MTADGPKRRYVDVDYSQGYPGGENCFYECLRCNTAIESRPADFAGIECRCGNIWISMDDARMGIKDKSQARYFCVED